MDHNHLANHLEDLDHLDNLNDLLIKFDSSTEEIPHNDNNNSGSMSSSSIRETPMDNYNKSPVTNKDTASRGSRKRSDATPRTMTSSYYVCIR